MPPLRERKSDILVLCEHFLKEIAEANGKAPKPFADEVLPALMAYDWPGNVRELRTVIEHGVVMSNGAKIQLRHLPGYLSHIPGGIGLRAPISSGRNKTPLAAQEKKSANVPMSESQADLDLGHLEAMMIREALARSGDNRTEAAEKLGISRRTLQRKLKEMGLIRRKRQLRDEG
jgi:DNA-binding NtrC family response regulator